MLLTSRPARSPLTHLERVKFTPSYDLNLSIRSRSPANTDDSHLPPLDADSRVLSALKLTQAQQTNLHDLHLPTDPGSLRAVANLPKQPPARLGRRSTTANLSTPGGDTVGFPHTRQQKLSVPKRVRFGGTEIIIIPPRDSLIPPTTPTKNSADEVQKPSNLLSIPDQANLSPSLVFSYENTRSTSSDHTCVPPALDHEISALDEFPDSPSVYSPTPPNSSVLSTFNPQERAPPQLDLAAIDIEHHPSVERSSDEVPSNEQPRRKDESTSESKDAAVNEQVPGSQCGNSTELPSQWGHVFIAAVVSRVANAWKGRTHITAAP